MIEDQENELGAMWRASTPVDVTLIADRVRGLNRLHRRINQTSFVVSVVIALLIGLAELLGELPTGGVLFAAFTALIIAPLLHHRWAKKRLTAQWSSEPRAMLVFAADRARAGLRLARGLYAGVPIGIIVGYSGGAALGRLNGVTADQLPLWALLATALLVAITSVAGVRMARRRSEDIKHFEARIRSMDYAV